MIGIDPGKEGAIALLNNDPNTCLFWLLRDVAELRTTPFEDIIKAYGVQHAYIEKAQAMPHQGVVSMFTYGTGYGRILGWCEMLALPYTLVPPKTWTKEIHQGCTGTDAKAKSAQAVKRLFPTENLRIDGSVKLHPGLIDALLIAEYGRRTFR